MPTTFANTIDGNEILAKRSQCDYAGNDIQTTYATKGELPTATSDLANDSDFITLSDVPAQVNADWDATSGVSEILNKPTIPSYTAGNGVNITSNVISAKVDGTTVSTNASGELTVVGGGGGGSQVNSDWDATSGVAEILNKPTPKTLTAGQGISITDGVSTVTISSTVTVPVQDVTVDGTSVVSNGVAAITSPTVDQTYDATSANAQSGVAVASGISDAVAALPTNLSSAQIHALKEALGVDETVLWEGSKTSQSGDNKLSLSITFPETVANFEYLKIFYWYRTTTNAAWKVDMCYVDNGEFHFTCQWPESATGNWFMYRLYGSGTSASGDGGYKAAASVNTFGSYGGGMWGNGTIWKVVGVHRVASN